MSNRKTFNRYSTLEEKLNTLNKQYLEGSIDLSDTDIVDSHPVVDSGTVSPSSVSYGGDSVDFSYQGETLGISGIYTRILSLNQIIGLSTPCRITIPQGTLRIENVGYLIKVEVPTTFAPQPNYIRTGLRLSFVYEDGIDYYYSKDAEIADGDYTFDTTVVARGFVAGGSNSLILMDAIYVEGDGVTVYADGI